MSCGGSGCFTVTGRISFNFNVKNREEIDWTDEMSFTSNVPTLCDRVQESLRSLLISGNKTFPTFLIETESVAGSKIIVLYFQLF